MWDELKRDDVAAIVHKNMGNSPLITEDLLETAQTKAAARQNWNLDQLKRLDLGSRRRYHDDMTIIVVDLQNQH